LSVVAGPGTLRLSPPNWIDRFTSLNSASGFASAAARNQRHDGGDGHGAGKQEI